MRHTADRIAAAAKSVAKALATLALCAGAAGCGGGQPAATRQAQTVPQGAQTPQVSDLALVRGPAQQRVAATIVAFYRAAWQGDAPRACSLFSPRGRRGFIRAAAASFPGGVINAYSTCAHAMLVYRAALAGSVSDFMARGVTVAASAFAHVGVADVRVRADRASAVAPLGVQPIITAKRILLVRLGGRWLIDGSRPVGR